MKAIKKNDWNEKPCCVLSIKKVVVGCGVAAVAPNPKPKSFGYFLSF